MQLQAAFAYDGLAKEELRGRCFVVLVLVLDVPRMICMCQMEGVKVKERSESPLFISFAQGRWWPWCFGQRIVWRGV